MSITLGPSPRMVAAAATLGAAVLIQLPLAASAEAATTSTGLRCTIVGTAKADSLRGTSGRDVICGLGGNDKITGLGGDDVIDGGSGTDSVYGGPGNDILVGGTGADALRGDSGNDKIYGGASADALNGGTGSDTCDLGPADTATSCSADSSKPHAAAWALDAAPGAGPKTVIATARVTDNFSGVAEVNLRLVGPGGTGYGGTATRVAGHDLDGIYRLQIVLPADAPAGSYELEVASTDRIGNAGFVKTTTTLTFAR